MRNFVVFFGLLLTGFCFATNPIGPRLAKVMDDNRPDQKHQVFIMLKEQSSVKKLLAERIAQGKVNPKSVRINLKSLLQEKRATQQRDILRLCSEMNRDGSILKYRSCWMVNAISAHMKIRAIKQMALQPNVAYVLLDAKQKMVDPKSPAINVFNEDKRKEDLQNLHRLGIEGQGIEVAILDTGINSEHVELKDKIIVDKGETFIPGETSPFDGHGHGTHCAGIVASNSFGVAPKAFLVPVKVLDDSGSGTFEGIIQGIEHAVEKGVDVVSMSLGGPASSVVSPLETAVVNAIDAGVTCVVAAGNSGPASETIDSPGTVAQAITVGAVDSFDKIASFSSRGPTPGGIDKPDIVAPGVSIVSTGFGTNGTQTLSGTSMATPYVAGVVALLLSKDRNLTPAQIKQIIISTAIKTSGNDKNSFGHGIIDALKAVNALSSPFELPEESNADSNPKTPQKEELPQDLEKAIFGFLNSSLYDIISERRGKVWAISVVRKGTNEVIFTTIVAHKKGKWRISKSLQNALAKLDRVYAKKSVRLLLKEAFGKGQMFHKVFIRDFNINGTSASFEAKMVSQRSPRMVHHFTTKEASLVNGFWELGNYSQMKDKGIIALINQQRSMRYITTLQKEPLFAQMAQKLAQNLIQKNPISNEQVKEYANQIGYHGKLATFVVSGDNMVPFNVFQTWMRSKSHRTHLLDAYARQGMANIANKETSYLVLVLGK